MASNELWLAYLTENIIRGCVKLARERCDGCKDHMCSILLHLCHQYSLLDKISAYFEEVRGIMLPNINLYYRNCEHILPTTSNKNKSREVYLQSGTSFLLQGTPQSIYWGRFIHADNHKELAALFNPTQ